MQKYQKYKALKMNIIQAQIKFYTGQLLFVVLAIAIICCFLASCSANREQLLLKDAQQQLWQNPDTCIAILCDIDTTRLLPSQYHEWQLCYQHAVLRTTRKCPSDSIMNILLDHFVGRKDYQHAGEAYYLMGMSAWFANNDHLAIQQLKEAEYYLLKSKQPDPNLLGVTYYRLGASASEERMFDIASSYHEKALPYLKATDNIIFITCAYRDLAYAQPDNCTKAIKIYLDSALHYASLLDYPVYQLEIQISKNRFLENEENNHAYYHTLCDSLGVLGYAYQLSDYYLSCHQHDSAKYYIDLLAMDTTNIWAKEHYQYQLASYLSAVGLKDSAILVLQNLHNWQTAEIENTAFARTYAIAQRYDLAKEQEHTLRLKLQKQRLHIAIVIIILALLIISWISIRIYDKHQYAIALNEQKKSLLRSQMLSRLKNSPKGGRKVPKKEDQGHTEWSQPLLHAEHGNYKPLVDVADVAFDNLLSQLQSQHNELTLYDQAMITLILLDFSPEECGALLLLEKEALWKRRKRLKKRLDLPQDTDLDDWLRQQLTVSRDY